MLLHIFAPNSKVPVYGVLPLLLLGCSPDTIKTVSEPTDEGVVLQDEDGDGYFNDEDCDDSDANVNTGSVETCDGLDNNCDGVIDEDVTDTFYSDLDGDGFGDSSNSAEACESPEGFVSNANDCDDENDQKYPGGIEVCDGLDNDCNADIDDGVGNNYYVDADNDGFGNPNLLEIRCEITEGLSEQAGDCDDDNNTIFPDANEYCDGLDNDCNEIIDDGGTFIFYADADSDGFGNENETIESCSPPIGYVSNGNDCDDIDTAISPIATEVCDGVDNNCNDQIDTDANDQTTFYEDSDEDGFGNAQVSSLACSQPTGFVSDSSDCDDENQNINPSIVEICDGVDNNCNDQIDTDANDQTTFYEDSDEDGFGNAQISSLACSQPTGFVSDSSDCDDENQNINPSIVEICDEIDNNCNNIVDDDASDKTMYYEDNDGDGFGNSNGSLSSCFQPEGYASVNNDCDDSQENIYPTADEICDEVDNNCNDLIDENDPLLVGGDVYFLDYDNDGYGNPNFEQILCVAEDGYVEDNSDCDDLHSDSYPNATEICDGRNNDCDEDVDEDVQNTYYLDNDEDGFGVDSTVLACSTPDGYADESGDCNDNNNAIFPSAVEVCDGIDNNCDALGEEGAHLIDEGLYQMWYLDLDQDGFGDSDTSFEGCEAPSLFVAESGDCDDNDPLYNPEADLGCDGLDYNCDGKVDNDGDEDGFASITCGGNDCNDSDATIFLGTDEIWYDGIDQNCDLKDDYDQDDDGYVADAYASVSDLQSGDCDDENSNVLPDPAGGCAYGQTCLDIHNSYSDFSSGSYEIDPDGWGTGLPPFTVYCDMDPNDPGWTEIPYAEDLPITNFTGGDGWRWVPNDFTFTLSDDQIAAIQLLSTEGKQDYVGLCNGVIHYQYHSNSGFDNAFGFSFFDGTTTPFGQASYSPYDINVDLYPDGDGCYFNGGENNSLDQATVFTIHSPLVPIRNVYSRDSGDAGETFSSPLTDNPAWLR